MRLKTFCLLLIALFPASGAFAHRVDSSTARTVAGHFAERHFTTDVTNRTLIAGRTNRGSIPAAPGAFYLFHVQPTGFLIVSADDRSRPVLAWSQEANFAEDSVPPHIQSWLDQYSHDIAALSAVSENPGSRYADDWDELIAAIANPKEKTTSVTPMLVTNWNQNGYYNFLCPYDSGARAHALTGCVSTVMAQLMRYWKWPQHGIGFHAYDDTRYGVLSANFGHTYYNWSAMPSVVSHSDSNVGRLMAQTGISVNMDYGTTSSSSYVLALTSPLRYNAQFALINYFCYNPEIQGLFRQNFTESSWLTTIEDELLAGRPVVYDGTNDSEGHSFIADGFDVNGLLHFNWGWGGAYNGYFSIDSIVPDGLSFMKNNTVLVGIRPDSSRSLIMDAVSQPDEPAYSLSPFVLDSKIINTGLTIYSGDVFAVLTGDAYPFFKQKGTMVATGIPPLTLLPGDSAAVQFQVPGLLPGSYHVRLWYSNTNSVDSTAEFSNNDPIVVFGDSTSMRCSLFPDPASDYCYVSLNQSDATSYRIVNSMGLETGGGAIPQGAPTLVLPVQFLTDGLYYVLIDTRTGVQRLPFVIVH